MCSKYSTYNLQYSQVFVEIRFLLAINPYLINKRWVHTKQNKPKRENGSKVGKRKG